MVTMLVPVVCSRALFTFCELRNSAALSVGDEENIAHIFHCTICQEQLPFLEGMQFTAKQGSCLFAVYLIPLVLAREPYTYVDKHPSIVKLFNAHTNARLPGCDCYARMCQSRGVNVIIRDPFGEALIELAECMIEEHRRRDNNSHNK